MRAAWAILLLMPGAAYSAPATTPVSVAQLQQWLDLEQGKPDGKVASQLSRLELTERPSAVQLAQWMAEFPGKRSRNALIQLADASAFFNLPQADIPPDAAPNPERQHQLLAETAEYVKKTLTRFPNFYATRQTTHFEDTLPHQYFEPIATTSSGRGGSRSMGTAGMSVSETDYQPLHRTTVYSAVVQYRDGVELRMIGKERSLQETGLTTSGEFGPILYIVLKDALSSDITWSHWEQGSAGPNAVFRYTVPQANSHFAVELQQVKGTQQVSPAYHGEIAVDPVDGTILRVTVIADLAPPYQSAAADILVEYAAVTIGAQVYVCPVHGVAFSKMPALTRGEMSTSLLQTQMNDVSFKDYHLFRGDARILPSSAAAGNAASATTNPPVNP